MLPAGFLRGQQHVEGFFEGLRQRKLVQWALAYIAAAFALIQILDIVAQRFGWPEWTERFAIIAAAFGFLITLVLAWYHGERGAQRVTGTELSILTLLLAIGGGLLWRFAPIAGVPDTTVIANPVADSKSIAVLPFENLSNDKANAYFASGIQDEILTKLAGVADLKVISRTSTEKYASRPDNLKVVAAELGVRNLLEGSLQKAGDRVRVNVQLINALTDTHLWANTYDRDMKDAFAVESEISQAIADALKAKLSPVEVSALAKSPTENAAAYDVFLQGEYAAHKGDDSGLDADYRLAEARYRQALALDPNFALADAKLAYTLLARHWFVKPISAAELAEAKTIVDRALALAPNLPDAHAALGYFHYWGHRDYASAKTEFQRVLTLEPNSVAAHVGLAAIHRRQGEWPQALATFAKVVAISPRDSLLINEYGQTFAVMRHYEDAHRELRRALALDPANLQASSFLALVELFGFGNAQDALQVFEDIPAETKAPTNNIGGEVLNVVNVRVYPYLFQRRYDEALKGWDVAPADTADKNLARLSARVAIQMLAGQRVTIQPECEQLRGLLEPEIARDPNEPALLASMSWAYVCLGRNADAMRSSRRAVELMPVTLDAYNGNYYLVGLAQIAAWAGQPDEALKVIAQLLAIPAGDALSVQRLKLDPVWDPLRADARFQALLNAPLEEKEVAADQ